MAAALSRLLPHPYNFSPVAAMALLGGAVFTRKSLAFLLPLGALFLSDLCFQLFTPVPGFYGGGQLINYGAFALIVALGWILIPRLHARNVVIASLAASTLFFLVSNLATWIFAGGTAPYTRDAAGLLNTFVLGIPFFGNTLLGDLFYCGVLFGSYALIRHFVMHRSRATA